LLGFPIKADKALSIELQPMIGQVPDCGGNCGNVAPDAPHRSERHVRIAIDFNS